MGHQQAINTNKYKYTNYCSFALHTKHLKLDLNDNIINLDDYLILMA